MSKHLTKYHIMEFITNEDTYVSHYNLNLHTNTNAHIK